MNTRYRAILEINTEQKDAERMLRKIQFDPRSDRTKPCEKMNYWDGKNTGLLLALAILRKVK